MQDYRDYEDFDPQRRQPKLQAGKIQPEEITGISEKSDAIRTLAILTFTGSGIAILFALISLLLIYVAGVWHPPQSGPTSFSLDNRSSIQIWFMTYCGVLLFSSIICILGAVVMLQRRIAGFWMYTIAQSVHFLVGICLLVTCASSDLENKFIEIQALNLLVCAGFVTLYIANKRHLRA